MTPNPLPRMVLEEPVAFVVALHRLQSMLEKRVLVELNHFGSFFGCGLEGALERVETLPPDNTSIRVVLSGGGGFFVDPADVETYLITDGETGSTWLEFQLRSGPTLVIREDDHELLAEAGDGAQ